MSEKSHVPQEMNQEQVRNILKYVEETQSDVVVASIFGRLGYECFYARHLDRWIGQYTGDVQAFLDRVNVQQASKYWERLEFSGDGRTLVLTGRPVQGCACAFADCADPPLSLCNHCCKRFQKALFGALLGQPVDVTITASYLQGDGRCCTSIHLLAK